MSTYTYELTGEATLCEVACPGMDELVVITPDAPYESDTALAIDVPGVEETAPEPVEPPVEPPPEEPPPEEPPPEDETTT